MKRLVVTILLAFAAGILPAAASAFTYSPPTFDKTAAPGDVVRDVLQLRNEAPDPVTITASVLNFAGKAGDETSGAPEFYPADDVRDGRGLAPWLSVPSGEIVIGPGERAELPFAIAVPKDAQPGSHFGAIVLSPRNPDGSGTVGVVGNAAALILVKVSGDVREDMKLTRFSAIPSPAGRLPVRFEARLQNDGNVHERPYGEITVTNLFGRTVAVLPINRADNKSVLPGSARRFQAEWTAKRTGEFRFGPYTARLVLHYGDGERLFGTDTTFWLFPWMTIVPALIGFLALAFGLKAFFTWYHRKIIARYERGKS